MKVLFVFLSCFILFSSCQKYQKSPLPAVKDVIAIEQERALDRRFDFFAILEYTSEYSPDLRLIKQQYRNSVAYAKLKAPLFNPDISMGLSKGVSLASATTKSVQPFISLGYRVPLWGKRKLTQELEMLEAEALLQKKIILHRAIYRDLIQAFIQQANLAFIQSINEEILLFIEADLKYYKMLLLDGTIGITEFHSIENEKINFEFMQAKSQSELLTILSTIANISGIPIEKLNPQEFHFQIPQLKLPIQEELLQIWIENSSELNQLRANYDISEKRLELEIRKQYPDLSLGGSYEKEPGETSQFYGLSLGMELPIFDRNQKSILLAHQEREQILLEYQTQVQKEKNRIDALVLQIQKLNTVIEMQEKKFQEFIRPNLEKQKHDFFNKRISVQEYFAARVKTFEMQRELNEAKLLNNQSLLELENIIGFSFLAPVINQQIIRGIEK